LDRRNHRAVAAVVALKIPGARTRDERKGRGEVRKKEKGGREL
jgi:hypothetical protein